MKLKDIAVNNLRRRIGRTIFLCITFLVVVGTTVALNAVSLGMRQELAKKLDSYGANIVVNAKSEHLTLSYGGLSVSGVSYNVQKLSSSVPDRLKKISNPADINYIAPLVIGSVTGNKQKYLLAGIDFAAEMKMKGWWKLLGSRPGPNEVVLGSSLAMRDKIGPGDEIHLNGKDYRISGVLNQTGGTEDKLVFSNIELARQLTGLKDSYTMIEVNAKNPETVAAEMAKLVPEAQVTPVTQLVQGAVQSASTFTRFAFSVTVLLALVGALVVIVTLAGNVTDRTREFGILRAIGFRQRHILTILLTEILAVSIVGGIGGYLLGISAPVAFSPLIQNASLGQQGIAQTAQAAAGASQPITFAWYPALGIISILAACLIGIVAIAYPAYRAIKLDPSEALRYI